MQDLASKMGGGEQQRSCSAENSLQLQSNEMARYHEEETLTGVEFDHSNSSSNSLQYPIESTHVGFCIYFLPFRDKHSMNYTCVEKNI